MPKSKAERTRNKRKPTMAFGKKGTKYAAPKHLCKRWSINE